MSKTNTHEDAYLKLLFQNVGFANIGDATGLLGSTTAGSLYVALFTAVANGETGTVTEITVGQYSNYARKAVARSAAGWTVLNSVVTNAAEIAFATIASGTGCTVTHYGIYTALTGGSLIGYGALTSPVSLIVGSTPKFAIGGISITEN